MCDASGAAAASRRPRWGRLYAIFPIAVAAFATVELETPASVVRTLLDCIAGTGVWVAIAWWVRANRAALDQLDWCACASARVTMRVIPSEPRQRPRRVIVEPTPIGDGGRLPEHVSRRGLIISPR